MKIQMLNTSLLDGSSMESVPTCLSTNNDDAELSTHPPRTNYTLSITENIDSRITQDSRTYLEKECFPQTEWSNKLFVNASTDKMNYQNMDITKYVGDS